MGMTGAAGHGQIIIGNVWKLLNLKAVYLLLRLGAVKGSGGACLLS